MSPPPAQLGPYPIERELGRGGTGVVYLGRDTRLNRPVAIKVLPDSVANNPESLARFEREARLLASVNHPNIATVYGIEEAQGQRLLVLEYIPGDTLAVQTARGKLPIDEAIDIGRQIALAIEAAHEAGVIHRDLKPGNVKITPDGKVKVLDFGLAKGTAVSDAELAHSPTMTFAATGQGVILGTAGYMSPEQARGKAVDRRTDIWSFGCVLFECLAGKQIFEGETVSDTIARILERDPDWNALPAATPQRVRDILRRCLEKDLKKRQRDIGDVRIELEEALAARATARSSGATPAMAASRAVFLPKTLAAAALIAVLGAAAGIAAWSALRGAGNAGTALGGGAPVRASIAIPPTISATNLSITPDGRTLLILGNRKNADGSVDPVSRIYTRRIDDYEFKPLAGTDRTQQFTVSSDSASIAIFQMSDQSTQRQLVKLPLDASSPPLKIAAMAENWNSMVWLHNGDFLVAYGNTPKYFRLAKGSETPGADVPLDLGANPGLAGFGVRLPNDRGVLFGVSSYSTKGWAIDLWVLDLATNKAHRLIENAGVADYSATGHLIFSRGETLMAAPFDLAQLKVTGEIVPLWRDLRIRASWAHGVFSMSTAGTLMFPPGGLVGADRRLVKIDLAGVVTPFGTERRGYEGYPVAARDGRQIAVVLANEKGTYEIWFADRDRPVLRRAVAIANADCDSGLWSPDGKRFAFTRTAYGDEDGVYVVNGDGSGTPQLIMKSDGRGSYVRASSWTPDGSAMIVMKSGGGKSSLFIATVAASGPPAAPRPLRSTSYSDSSAQLTRDGRLLSFQSDESGKVETYVALYATGGIVGAPMMVSNGGGTGAEWAADNRRLFFEQPDGQIAYVTVDTKPSLTASKPVVAYDTKKLHTSNGWTILADGSLFTIQRSEAEDDDVSSFNVVFNWFDELRARMGRGVGK